MTERDTTNDDLLQLEDARLRATLAGDFNALSRIYDESLVYVHASGRVHSSRSEFLEYLREFVQPLEIKRTNSTLRVIGDTALMWGNLENRALQKKTGQMLEFKARVLQVWVKQGGEWKNAAVHCTRLES